MQTVLLHQRQSELIKSCLPQRNQQTALFYTSLLTVLLFHLSLSLSGLICEGLKGTLSPGSPASFHAWFTLICLIGQQDLETAHLWLGWRVKKKKPLWYFSGTLSQVFDFFPLSLSLCHEFLERETGKGRERMRKISVWCSRLFESASSQAVREEKDCGSVAWLCDVVLRRLRLTEAKCPTWTDRHTKHTLYSVYLRKWRIKHNGSYLWNTDFCVHFLVCKLSRWTEWDNIPNNGFTNDLLLTICIMNE